MKKLILFGFLLSSSLIEGQTARYDQWAEGTLAIGEHRGSLSLMTRRDWRVFKNRKFHVGIGIRFTSFLATDLYHITAPAKLTSGSTSPLVIFKENIANNIDSLLLDKSQVNALNLMINLGYRFSNKFQLGFNIDVIGFSFGRRQQANYINGNTGQITNTKPTPFNILLISDNDRGSLNSELFGRYFLNDKWGVKLAAQFLFTEFTTSTNVQQFPEPNNRFRNKSLMASFGITRKF